MSHRCSRLRVPMLVLGGALATALFAPIAQAGEEGEPQAANDAPTKYYLLMRPFRFTPTGLGATPQVESYGGGPSWLPLEQCEVTARGAQRFPLLTHLTQVHEQGRLKEVAIWYGGVVCHRYAFRYDGDGRLAGRTDTEYELQREGEDWDQWVNRMRGKTPEVACVWQIAYTWSEDGRTVEAKMVSRQGDPSQAAVREAPSISYGTPGTVLETWKLDGKGHVVEVVRDGQTRYSATYDEAGRLVTENEWGGEETQHTYDAQGRIVKTMVKRGIGDFMTFAHGYPGAPASKAPEVAPERHSIYVVRHDEAGYIAEIDVREPTGDPTGNFTVLLQRDDQGRVKSMHMRVRGFPVPFFEE